MNQNFYLQSITKLDNRAILKILTAREGSTQASIINKLKEKGTTIPQPTFSNKIKRNALKVEELQQICELYGYELMLGQRY